MYKNLKEKIIGISGSISGLTSVLGSWQICHNVCLGLIVLLSIIGITLTGMPLAFLTKVAIPFWIIAFSLLILTSLLYFKKKCISNKLLIFNAGLVTIGVPFQQLNFLNPVFWIIGITLVVIAISLFIKGKWKK